MDDLLTEFLTETAESIEVVDSELVKLEQDPGNKPVLDNIFRLVHTIKGTCGFLGLPRLEAVAHASENVLGKFRDGEIEVTAGAVTVVLESLDQIKEILAGLEAAQDEPEGDDADLISRLNMIASGGEDVDVAAPMDELEAAFAAAPGPDDVESDPVDEPAAATMEAPESLFERVGGAAAIDAAVDIFYGKVIADKALKLFFDNINMDMQRPMMAAFLTSALGGPSKYTGKSMSAAHAPLVANGLNQGHFDAVIAHLGATLKELNVAEDMVAEIAGVAGALKDDVLCLTAEGKQLVDKFKAANASKAGASKPAAAAKPDAETGKKLSVANQTIRVNVDVLEDLMTMVSELVLTRNQLDQIVRSLDDSEFAVPLQRLNQCTSELQEAVMKTRMQPIGNAWAKLPRIVRDLCQELDKKIDLQMRGAETELDRQVLEMIKDPLTHMVRNSGDHGIEKPADRLAAGKPEQGRILLNAYHEGGHIMIEISDDGHGLAVDKIRQKAIANGLASEADIASMSDQQIQKFIFHAGLSTAEKVTAVSGRGVGMDVVRSNIEKIGGTIDVKSKEGKGSTFIIKIPLTLAIVSALIVDVASERFAIPQLSVLELVRTSQESEHKIERINNTPVLRLRNRLLSLVYLRDVLGLGYGEGEEEKDITDLDEAFIVVSQVGSFTFGIVVDRVFDTEEIVVKPIAPILRDISLYSGNTILGDGSVIMILDPNGIAAMTNETMHGASASDEVHEQVASVSGDRETLLTFRIGNDAPRAVPLSLVARLEEIEVDQIEVSDGRSVVQYRGRLMPLVKVDDSYAVRTEGRQPVLVFTDGERSMGLAVDEIIDIVEDEFEIELCSDTTGVVGTAVISEKATEIIDVAHYLGLAFSKWFAGNQAEDGTGTAKNRARVLVVDDSPFFRNMIKPLLSAAGYRVTTAEDANHALALRENGQHFDVILSDIEMPGMDGFQFAEAVRGDGPWQKTPIVALSSHNSPRNFERGREVGFCDYVEKFDRSTLLTALSESLAVNGEAA